MPWLTIAFISVVSISVANLFQRLAMKEEGSDPVTSVITTQLFLGIATTFVALLRGFALPPLAVLFPYAIVSSLLYAVGSLLFFKAIKVIEASEAALFSTFGTVVTLIAAYFFLGERLTQPQLFGVTLIIASIIVIKFEKQSLKFNRGSLLNLAGTSLFGIAIVIDTFVIRSYDTLSYLAITSVLPALMQIGVFRREAGMLVRELPQRVSRHLLIFSLLYSVTAIGYFMALEAGALASQMSPIFKVQTVLTVVLAAVFLKETSHLSRKALSALLVTIGILLIR